jgi:hypothetical protein
VGGLGALGVQSLLAGPAPSATSAPSAAPTDDTAAVPSDAPTDSVAPVAPVSPVLENRLPKTIAGVDLTVQSAVDATNLSNGPNGRALNATMVRLGKQPSDLEIALAFDQSGSLDLTIIGFRADGVASGEIRTAVMDAWLAAGTPGVVTSSVALSGAQATKLSYGDGGADEYVLTIDDSVFVLETSDVTLAQSAASALIAGPAASSAATASPGS